MLYTLTQVSYVWLPVQITYPPWAFSFLRIGLSILTTHLSEDRAFQKIQFKHIAPNSQEAYDSIKKERLNPNLRINKPSSPPKHLDLPGTFSHYFFNPGQLTHSIASPPSPTQEPRRQKSRTANTQVRAYGA